MWKKYTNLGTLEVGLEKNLMLHRTNLKVKQFLAHSA